MTIGRKPISWRGLALHIASLFAFIGLLATWPASMTVRWWLAYLMLAAMVGATVFAVVLLAHRRTFLGRIVVAMSCQAIALILLFALVYSQAGLLADRGVTRTPFDPIYFSIVTWTTLGYGDFQPAPPFRMMAAIEAIIGYVYLGLIVGLASNLFRPPERSARRSE